MIHQGKIVVCCQGLIGGRKKRIIHHFGPLGFQPRTKVQNKSDLPLTGQQFITHREVSFFLPRSSSHTTTPHTEHRPRAGALVVGILPMLQILLWIVGGFRGVYLTLLKSLSNLPILILSQPNHRVCL